MFLEKTFGKQYEGLEAYIVFYKSTGVVLRRLKAIAAPVGYLNKFYRKGEIEPNGIGRIGFCEK